GFSFFFSSPRTAERPGVKPVRPRAVAVTRNRLRSSVMASSGSAERAASKRAVKSDRRANPAPAVLPSACLLPIEPGVQRPRVPPTTGPRPAVRPVHAHGLGGSRRDRAGRRGSDRMKILVVEDEAKAAAYLHKGLTENGFVADVAADGDDGLHLA